MDTRFGSPKQQKQTENSLVEHKDNIFQRKCPAAAVVVVKIRYRLLDEAVHNLTTLKHDTDHAVGTLTGSS
jgi:hypothetical protein